MVIVSCTVKITANRKQKHRVRKDLNAAAFFAEMVCSKNMPAYIMITAAESCAENDR